jgi:N-acetylglucosaminyldiphosphoundecaprenol N-acetyl-beta-D-mannosaminyltransferase
VTELLALRDQVISSCAAPPRYDVLGIGVSVVSPATALGCLIAWSKDEIGRFVCIRDVHGIMHARHDPDFREIHREAAMVTPDGMPLAWIGTLRRHPVERTCGPDLMLAALAASADQGLKHYFCGGKEGVAEELAERMRTRFQGVQIVGIESPPFGELANDEVRRLADRLNASGADLVWIGLSTPKQEKLMRRLRPMVTSTLIGVGAAFDIHAGRINRAPRWMQRLSLEGVYRLIKEPKRLWRRYLVLAPQFVALATAQELGRKFGAKVTVGPGDR